MKANKKEASKEVLRTSFWPWKVERSWEAKNCRRRMKGSQQAYLG